MKILVTGTAGFIGYHVVRRLLERGDDVVGLDNINDYYDVRLKYDRLAQTGIKQDRISDSELVRSSRYPAYQFIKTDIKERKDLERLFEKGKFERVCHLAAQAGVRYSLENPHVYVDSNLVGFVNLIDLCRIHRIGHLIYASSSSVYGLNPEMPFAIRSDTDHPVSLYGATKKCNELIAHSYSHLFGLPTTGLRFFTVYGPWGRPDMAAFVFAKAILEKDSNRILGFHIIGPFAPELIQEVTNAMASGGETGLIVNGMHIHPALNELIEAALGSLEEA